MASTALSNTAVVIGLLFGFVLLSMNYTIPPAGEKAFHENKGRGIHQMESNSWKLPMLGQLKYCQSSHGASLISRSLPAKAP